MFIDKNHPSEYLNLHIKYSIPGSVACNWHSESFESGIGQPLSSVRRERESHSVGRMFKPFCLLMTPSEQRLNSSWGWDGRVSIWVGWLVFKIQTHVR